MSHRRTFTALAAGLTQMVGTSLAGTSAAAPTTSSHGALTNLAHLDWLGAQVSPAAQTGHTTYQLDQKPGIGVLWTYAEPNPDGTFRHVGAASTTRPRTPMAKELSTPTTCRGRPSSTCGTGSSRARPPVVRQHSRCFAG